LKNIAGKARPDRYLANLSSRILGWVDRDTQWMCDAGENCVFQRRQRRAGSACDSAAVRLDPHHKRQFLTPA
jgi:hypothetical protein